MSFLSIRTLFWSTIQSCVVVDSKPLPSSRFHSKVIREDAFWMAILYFIVSKNRAFTKVLPIIFLIFIKQFSSNSSDKLAYEGRPFCDSISSSKIQYFTSITSKRGIFVNQGSKRSTVRPNFLVIRSSLNWIRQKVVAELSIVQINSDALKG